MEKYSFGIDIGGTSVKIGMFKQGEILEEKWEIPTRREDKGKYVLSDINRAIQQKMKDRNISSEQIQGIGFGVPGPIRADGTVLTCANLGWGVFNVVEEASKITGISNVKVANDANVATLGEMWKGGGKGFRNIVMITLGTGVGGGVIINGQIVAGANGAAGEIGHLTVNYDEKDACGCGKHGCLEQFASATGIVKEARRMLKRTDKPSKIRELQHLSAKVIFDAAKEGDGMCLELVDQLGRYLAIAASHVAGIVDPEVFVIGGGVSRAGQFLIDAIKKHYNEFAIYALKDKEFHLAELGNDAGMYGCAKMVLDN